MGINTVKLLGHNVTFTPHRVPTDSRQENKYYYELRHGDDFGIPETLETSVTINFYGTIIAKQPLVLSETSTDINRQYHLLTRKEKEQFVLM